MRFQTHDQEKKGSFHTFTEKDFPKPEVFFSDETRYESVAK